MWLQHISARTVFFFVFFYHRHHSLVQSVSQPSCFIPSHMHGWCVWESLIMQHHTVTASDAFMMYEEKATKPKSSPLGESKTDSLFIVNTSCLNGILIENQTCIYDAGRWVESKSVVFIAKHLGNISLSDPNPLLGSGIHYLKGLIHMSGAAKMLHLS